MERGGAFFALSLKITIGLEIDFKVSLIVTKYSDSSKIGREGNARMQLTCNCVIMRLNKNVYYDIVLLKTARI